jgi:hypothetical protein
VTYTLELSAQFAKEAMACQSLDSDEILNVRWATEDPNPTSKVAEKRRLEETGRAAIQARMDPRIVDAMRAVKALEDGVLLDEEGNLIEGPPDGEDGQEEDGEQPSKRRRMDVDPDEDQTPAQAEQDVETVREKLGVKPVGPTGGLLSADALEGLKYFAQIRAQREGAQPAQQTAPPPKPLVSMGVGDYGSDDED